MARLLRSLSGTAGLAVPAVILALAMFILIDNFTYTVLKFGVKTITGWGRLVYAVLTVVLIAFAWQHLRGAERSMLEAGRRRSR